MFWLRNSLHAKIEFSQPPEGMDTEEEKQWRLSLLNEDELKAFEWFRLGYTARWTAETMLLNRKVAKRLFGTIFSKLNAADEAEISRLYRTVMLNPQELSDVERSCNV